MSGSVFCRLPKTSINAPVILLQQANWLWAQDRITVGLRRLG